MEQHEDLSYYDILNVPRDASAEDIKKAYHRLAQAFHPDKQSSEELRATATGAFSDIQEAYEVWQQVLNCVASSPFAASRRAVAVGHPPH